MKIEMKHLRSSDILSMTIGKQFIIPEYQREYCWSVEKMEKFADSLMTGIFIGILQLRELKGNDFYEVIDGLHRITTLKNILTGNGFYFDFKNKRFTTNDSCFSYKQYVKTDNATLRMISKNIEDEIGLENLFSLLDCYDKLKRVDLMAVVYNGTDEEVKNAFDVINDKGVAVTPIFNKVQKKGYITL